MVLGVVRATKNNKLQSQPSMRFQNQPSQFKWTIGGFSSSQSSSCSHILNMAERILLAFICCSILSLVISICDRKSVIINTIVGSLIEILSVLKIFGIALGILVVLGVGIACWEQVIGQSNFWSSRNQLPWSNLANDINTTPTTSSSTSSTAPTSRIPSVDDHSKNQSQRSILPIALVVSGLALLSLIDRPSLLYYTSSDPQPAPYPRDPHPPMSEKINPNRSVSHFFSAVLTLAIVAGFIVFNRDEYRAWKARRKLLKQNRRITRGVNNSQATRPKPTFNRSL